MDSLADVLIQAAPAANPDVLRAAAAAAKCAIETGHAPATRLGVIDYSLPSTQPRLWVFDLNSGTLLYQELVAHGRNSGDNLATAFSNEASSLQSSLGLYETLDTYAGDNGYSLRMQGLEPGVNDHAYDRAIVMHGAPYVSQSFIKKVGRIGRSWGCPAVRPEIAHSLIDTLKGGQYVFAYYPDPGWLAKSAYLHCADKSQPEPQPYLVDVEMWLAAAGP
ncbi:MAG TPA: murein L,D-transpeptidase catalytic domain family protein [Nevskiaceae bacterium]|nr:murein L,D-transpeptidase catalytic domain family protein [Nevskiaceae bacterium]